MRFRATARAAVSRTPPPKLAPQTNLQALAEGESRSADALPQAAPFLAFAARIAAGVARHSGAELLGAARAKRRSRAPATLG